MAAALNHWGMVPCCELPIMHVKSNLIYPCPYPPSFSQEPDSKRQILSITITNHRVPEDLGQSSVYGCSPSIWLRQRLMPELPSV